MKTVSAKFTEKDAELMEGFVRGKYFLNKSDLIRTAVRHYLNEQISNELMRKAKTEQLTEHDVDKINKEIRKIRKGIWNREFKRKNVGSST